MEHNVDAAVTFGTYDRRTCSEDDQWCDGVFFLLRL